MRVPSPFRFGLVLSSLILASCSGGGGNPGGGGGGLQTAPNVVYSIPGPYSQVYTPAGGTPFTMTNVMLTYTGFPGMPAMQPYEYLRIDVTFSQDISTALPEPGTSLQNGSQLGVYVGIDSDNNEATGLYAIGCQGFPSQTKMGDEFFVDAGTYYGRLKDGNYSVVEAATSSGAGEAITTVSGNTLTELIDLGIFASFSTVPKIGVFVSALNGATYDGTAPVGQCAPSQGHFVTG